MSDAKRDNSAFRCTAATGHAPPRSGSANQPPPAPSATLKLQTLKLEKLEIADPWGSTGTGGGDPYNAVGPRVGAAPGRHPQR